MFAIWRISNDVISDDGIQFTSTSFSDFASKYEFTHSTVSPHFPQVNGEVESGVKIVKKDSYNN